MHRILRGFDVLTKGNVRSRGADFNIFIRHGFTSHTKTIRGSTHSNNEDKLVFKISKGVGYAFAIDGISKSKKGGMSATKWKEVIESITLNPFGKTAIDIVKEFRAKVIKKNKGGILEHAVLSGIIFFKEKDYWRYIFVYGGDGGFAIIGKEVFSPLVKIKDYKIPLDIGKHTLPNGNFVYHILLDDMFDVKHCSILSSYDFVKQPMFLPIPSFIPVFEFRRLGFTPFIVYTDGITEVYLGFAGGYSHDSFSRFMKGLLNDDIAVDVLKKYAKKFREQKGLSGWDDMSYIVVKKE